MAKVKRFQLLKKNKNFKFFEKKKSKLITIYNNLNEINFLKYKYLMICVKPQDIEKLIKQLNEFIKLSNTIISFVAGIKISSLSKSFHMKLSILRFMPNLSIRYGKSITAVYSTNVLEKEKKISNFFTFLVHLSGLEMKRKLIFSPLSSEVDLHILVIFLNVYKIF